MEKQRWKESERRREEERRSEKRKSEKRKRQAREKVGKSRFIVFFVVFPMICGSGRSKSRLAKAAGAEPSGEMRDEKLHAVVARSTCGSQNVQYTSAPDHFCKLRCRKGPCHCSAKHISKSKCTRHHARSTFASCDVEKVHAIVARSTFPSQNVQGTMLGALLEVDMSKSARRFGAKHVSKSKC